MEIKRFLKKLLPFILFLICIYFALLSIFSLKVFKNKVPNLLDFHRSSLAADFYRAYHSKDVDVLFLGSSHAEFVPYVFQAVGINAVNMRVPGLQPLNTYYLVQNGISTSHSKVVVLESYFYLFKKYNYSEPTMYILSNNKINFNLTTMAFASEYYWAINSEMGMIANRIFHPFVVDTDTSFRNLIKNDTNKLNRIDARHLRAPKPKYESFRCNVIQSAFTYFQKSIDILKQNKKKVVLIMAPVPQPFIASCKNYNSICFSIDSIARRSDIVFINYNDSANYSRIKLKSNDFFDDNHLTKSGSIKFSEVVAADMKKLHLY